MFEGEAFCSLVRWSTVCALLALVGAGNSLGQDRRDRGDIVHFRYTGFNGMGSYAGTTPDRIAGLLVGLINHKPIQADLELTPEQIAAAKRLKDESAPLIDLRREYAARLDAGKEVCSKIGELLEKKQATRLIEISVQVRSIDALADAR
jgi:hypothetical protein